MSEEDAGKRAPDATTGSWEAEPTLTTPAHTPQAGLAGPATRVGREQAGRYELLRELARGGQGIVHAAWDAHLGREVAFKQLRHLPAREGSADTLTVPEARFVREARITAQLDHPGIAPLYEVARRADGSLYATQRLVRGRTLAAALAECKTLEERLRLLPAFHSACEAMAYAHGRGVIHRDLKPANVMIQEDGSAVVLDWGLGRTGKEGAPAASGAPPVDSLLDGDAARTHAGALLGTPAYASPEQAAGAEGVDARSDVWSLGVVLYELLAGRRPFEGGSAQEVLRAVAAGAAPPLALAAKGAPRALVEAAERAMSRDPVLRPASAAGLAEALGAWLAQQEPSRLAAAHGGRRRMLVAGLALGALLLAGAAVWRTASPRRPPPKLRLNPAEGAGDGTLSIFHVAPRGPLPAGHPATLRVAIVSTAGVDKAAVFLRPAGATPWAANVPLKRLGGARWAAEIPGGIAHGTFEYLLVAKDTAGTQVNVGAGGPVTPFKVAFSDQARAPAATGQAAPEGAPLLVHRPPAAPRAAGPVTLRATVTAKAKTLTQVYKRAWHLGPDAIYEQPVSLGPSATGAKGEVEATLEVPADGFDYYLEAFDELGNGPARAGSPEAPLELVPGGS